MLLEVNAQKRTLQGTGASRRLRRAGRVPAVVYGGDKDAQAIDIDHNEIWHKLRQEVFHSSILALKVDGASENVLLRDVQLHPYKRQVLHLDFQRVDAKQAITLNVPLHFINGENAPGVKLQAGIISHVITEVEVKCLPADLPDYIEVDVGELSAGHSIHLSAVVMPKGVELVPPKGEDPVVVSIAIPRGASTEEASAEATDDAAPAATGEQAAEKK